MPLIPRTINEIRVSVTGLGKMGVFHTNALRQLGGGSAELYYKSGLREQVGKIRICGLCDPDPARTRLFNGLPLFTDHRMMLREAQPDIAIIATPSRSHFDLALAALEAEAHTFVEKPATTHVSQWNELVKYARMRDLRIMAGHVERYNPVTIKLRTLLAEQTLHIRDYTFRRCQPRDPRIPDDIVTDKLIHDLDLALFLFGPITSHSLIASKQVEGQTREVILHLTHLNGMKGELLVSWLHPDNRKIRECLLRTTEGGEIRGDFVNKKLSLNSVDIECSVPDWIKPDNNQIKDELADFVGHCLVPDPQLPTIHPLLSPREVGAAIAITEQVSDEIAGSLALPSPKQPFLPPFKIGVMVESFRVNLREGLETAAALNAQGIQFYATSGETRFDLLRGPALIELKAMLQDLRLEVSAVCGDFGGHGFALEAENPTRIANTRRVIELAAELNCRVVTTHIGVIPPDPDHPRRAILAKACIELGRFAYAQGVVLAIETGPEPASVLQEFIAQLNLPGGVGVNFDPANLVMVCREDIPSAVHTLAPYIVHTHAKDGLNLRPVNAERLYAFFAGERDPDFDPAQYLLETPLGAGAVPFPAYLATLGETGYRGYLTVERECGEHPLQDIQAAVKFLKESTYCIPSIPRETSQ